MGNKKISFKVGDKIVDFGQVCRIFKVKKQKNKQGEAERVIFFRPYFKTKINKTCVYSIPAGNIEKAKIRRPITKTKMARLLKKLSQKTELKNPVSAIKLREKLKLNKAGETAVVLKRLWLDKNDGSSSFTNTKRGVFDLAMTRLVEEVAFLGKTTPQKAKEKIKNRLDKLIKI